MNGRATMLSLVLAVACAHASPGRNRQIAIAFEPPRLSLCQGMAEYVQVHVGWTGANPGSSDAPPELQWISRSPETVRVDPDGRIVALRPGQGRVRVRAAWDASWNTADLRVDVHRGSLPDTAIGPRILTSPSQCR